MGLEASNWGFLLVFLTLLGQADSGKGRECIPITQLGKLRTGCGWGGFRMARKSGGQTI